MLGYAGSKPAGIYPGFKSLLDCRIKIDWSLRRYRFTREKSMTVARQLAERILAPKFQDLPAEALHWAKIGILDTVGVTIAGASERCTAITAATPGIAESDGPAVLFGLARRTSVLDAVLINGVASHALDYDDVNNQIGGHPSVPLVPAIFAVADMVDISGEEAIAAYVAGFEVETQIGLAVHYQHYAKGWHPTATLGIFGTVAAGARLLGLNVDQTAQALALAVSLASGVKANFGTMTKPLHIGHSLRNGVMAVLMARDGFTANEAAFEHKQGFFEVFNGSDAYDASKIFDDWGTPWNVTDPGPSLKAYPCCGSTHGAIDCALALHHDHALELEDIAKIDIRTDPKRLPHTDNPDPTSGLGAKFSIQYVVARALINGAVRLGDFENAAYDDREARDLMMKVSAGVHPDMNDPNTDTYAAEVTIIMSDGRELSHRSGDVVLRGPGRPMDEETLFGKFADCMQRQLPGEAPRPLYEMLLHLETLSRLSAVTDYLAAIEPSGTMAAE